MVRGGRYQRGGSGRGGYRDSYDGYSRPNTSRSTGYNNYRGGSSYRGGSGGGGGSGGYRFNNNGGGYNDTRSRYRITTDRRDDRLAGKRPYRERSDDRKRPRNEGSRRGLDYGHHQSSSNYGRSSYDNGPSSYNRRRDSNSRHSSSTHASIRSSNYRINDRDDRNGSSSRLRNDRMGPPTHRIIRRPMIRGRRTTANTGPPRRIYNSNSGSNDANIRRKILSLRVRDNARRVRLARLRSTNIRRRAAVTRIRKRSDDDNSDKGTSKEDKDDKPKMKKEKDDSTTKKDENADDDDVGKEKANDKDTAKSDRQTVESTKVDGDKGDVSEKKSDGKDKRSSSKTKSKTDVDSSKKYSSSPRKYIKLTCVHCHIRSLTFKDYANHLYSRTHRTALRRVALRQKAQLARMRNEQRKSQRQLEVDNEKVATEEADGQVEDMSYFCLLCRLKYHSSKTDHQNSEAHRNMRKFLTPYCKACRIGFRSPIVYETHRCSIDHIKNSQERREKNGELSDENEREVDLEQFTTVDSVGDVDDANGDSNEFDDGAEKKEKEDTSHRKTKQDVTVGTDHIKKVEVLYCDLCRYYLPHWENEEFTIKKHCTTRNHFRSYLRYMEKKSLSQTAEKVHRRQQERDAAKKKDGGDKKDGDKKKSSSTGEAVGLTTSEEQMWDIVDKDLGELLQEVGNEDGIPVNGNDDEDEEEDSRATNERYDRFKNSDMDGVEEEPSENADIILKEIKKEPDTEVENAIAIVVT